VASGERDFLRSYSGIIAIMKTLEQKRSRARKERSNLSPVKTFFTGELFVLMFVQIYIKSLIALRHELIDDNGDVVDFVEKTAVQKAPNYSCVH
jgi:hypothetical protein